MAGIVPVHANKGIEDFKYPWHDTMMPIAPDLLAVERAVAECAWVGADTIWLVVSDDVHPLIRKRLGDYVHNPKWQDMQKPYERKIPIYYCPVTVWDRGVRDCHAWGALHGCYIADKVGSKISFWLRPDLFYIAWPYGVYDPVKLRPFRTEIRDRYHRVPTMLTYQGKTVKDGEYLGFTITWDEAKRLRRRVWHKQTLAAGWNGEYIEPKDRYNARWFEVEDIFDDLNTEGYREIELEDYRRIDSWEGYVDCLANTSLEKDELVFKGTNYKFKGVGSKNN
jgi:hypothetical protein